MKRFICLPLIFVFFGLYSQTFAPVGAEWYYTEIIPFAPSKHVRHEVLKDTLYEGEQCKKISGGIYVYEKDSIVYYWEKDIDDFQILFNFKAKTGYEWVVKIFSPVKDEIVNVYYKVQSTEKIIINGTELKKLHLIYGYDKEEGAINYKYPSEILTVIGSMDYLLHYHSESELVADVPFVSGLRCYNDNNFGLYKTEHTSSCEVTGLEAENDLTNVKVFPNPVANQLNIAFKNLEATEVKVSDMYGNVIDSKYASGSVSFDFSDYKPGLYVILIKDEGGLVARRKVFKQ